MRAGRADRKQDAGSAAATKAEAVVVLGCRVTRHGPSEALARRLERTAAAALEYPSAVVVASGGKRWHGTIESRVMKAELVRLGVAEARIVEEDESLNTRENAARVATLLAARGIHSVILVTSDFHLRRARLLFRLWGLSVTALGADAGLPNAARPRVILRECGALVFDCLLAPLTGTLLRLRTSR